MTKKNVVLVAAVFLAVVLMIPAFAIAAPPADKGNGAPNGPHWNLNIIGVSKSDRNMPDDLSSGNVVFVKLGRDSQVTTRINLECGDEFAVLDKDGTDGSATVQLMDPYPDDVSPGINTGEEAVYQIYVRALGKPGGNAVMTSGFTDEYGVDWLSLESVEVERTKGQSRFSDETIKLTTVYVLIDLTDDGIDNPVLTRLNLFGNDAWEYFWDYTNSGLKLLQMRIYLVE